MYVCVRVHVCVRVRVCVRVCVSWKNPVTVDLQVFVEVCRLFRVFPVNLVFTAFRLYVRSLSLASCSGLTAPTFMDVPFSVGLRVMAYGRFRVIWMARAGVGYGQGEGCVLRLWLENRPTRNVSSGPERTLLPVRTDTGSTVVSGC